MNKTTRPVMRTPRKPKPTTSTAKKAHTAKPNARAVTLTIIAKRRIWQLLSGSYHASSYRETEKTKPRVSSPSVSLASVLDIGSGHVAGAVGELVVLLASRRGALRDQRVRVERRTPA